jgi:outer membrane protein with beta-barrel domain
MRSTVLRLCAAVAVLLLSAAMPCRAQGIGIGGRFSLVRGDVQAEASAERFTGGQIRAWLSKRAAIELSLDRRIQSNEALTERVRDYPLQASVLLTPVRSTFAPYVLGGMGWYTHRVDQLAGKQVVESTTTRRVGSHAGFGAEMRFGRRAALHADYRYTFLRFGAADPLRSDTIAGAIAKSHLAGSTSGARFLPSYQGSMWTTGLTIYF